jgi:nitrate reductase alpha subunit
VATLTSLPSAKVTFLIGTFLCKIASGWAHYVGQEKLRPQTGWQPLAFGLDWHRPPRHMNGTSFFYNHSSQWRYEKLGVDEILSPLADKKDWENYSMIDCNVRSLHHRAT